MSATAAAAAAREANRFVMVRFPCGRYRSVPRPGHPGALMLRACPLINHVCERGRLGRVREARRSLGWRLKASQATKQSAQTARSRRVGPNARSTLSAGSGVGPTTPFAILRVSHRIGVKRITRFIDGQALRLDCGVRVRTRRVRICNRTLRPLRRRYNSLQKAADDRAGDRSNPA